MADFSKFQFQGEYGRDEFQREPIAEKIIQLLTSEIDISPMIIDGDWGTGKSEFCHKLINKFKINKFKDEKDGYQIIYIDAFKADHADNPLMTIFAEIIKLVPEKDKVGFMKKALPVIRYGTKALLKAGVSHIMKKNADDIADELEGTIQDAANSAIDATITVLLKDHEEAEKNLEALQSLLAKLAKDKPIVIFIDELDRCRPDFSVSMLEVIKHTFNVKNVKFVLVTNTVQLKAAIKHAYGLDVDAQRYLDKFIKFIMALPKNYGDEYNSKISSVEYFNQLVKESEILSYTVLCEANSKYKWLLHPLITSNNLSLREVESLVRYIEIAYILEARLVQNEMGYIMLYLIGVFIACFKPNLQYDFSKKMVDANDILGLIGIDKADIGRINMSNGIILLLASQASINSEMVKKAVEEFNNQSKNNLLERSYFSWGLNASEYFQIVLRAINTLNLGVK